MHQQNARIIDFSQFIAGLPLGAFINLCHFYALVNKLLFTYRTQKKLLNFHLFDSVCPFINGLFNGCSSQDIQSSMNQAGGRSLLYKHIRSDILGVKESILQNI